MKNIKLLEAYQHNSGNIRYSFDYNGVFVWLVLDSLGCFVDGTFKDGTEPHKNLIKSIVESTNIKLKKA